jgi:hypothetical protein
MAWGVFNDGVDGSSDCPGDCVEGTLQILKPIIPSEAYRPWLGVLAR